MAGSGSASRWPWVRPSVVSDSESHATRGEPMSMTLLDWRRTVAVDVRRCPDEPAAATRRPPSPSSAGVATTCSVSTPTRHSPTPRRAPASPACRTGRRPSAPLRGPASNRSSAEPAAMSSLAGRIVRAPADRPRRPARRSPHRLLDRRLRRRSVRAVPRRTSGRETYGAGRYLLDTIKGADLGGDGRHVVLDFNYAYHPSCAYDPRWSLPADAPRTRSPCRFAPANDFANPDRVTCRIRAMPVRRLG